MYKMKELSWREVAKRLRTLRKQHGLTIEKLAEMVNVSTSFIGLIEKGESGVSLENLYKLSQVYGVSLDYLVSGNASSGAPDKAISRLISACYGYSDSEIAVIADLAKVLRGKIHSTPSG